MLSKVIKRTPLQRRARRVRGKVVGTPARPRLCVVRTLKHIYCQIIDDLSGATLAAASTLSPEVQQAGKSTWGKAAAQAVGKLIAEKAKAKGIAKVAFDRSGRKYHGRVKALADAAREGGLHL
ncbi:MAG TPA: 50S ribosomal protein L18 [Phycisphaerae bacterium]|nr:50S ribosomal protein L18 [Phycisphaerae bacterium]HOI54053.1 50S ribosomal protein L18 [Phycisphaerae bacterium]